jgi:plastocyanin
MILPIALTAFESVGIVLAAWAVLVAALGTTRHDFPGNPRLEKAVMGVSVLLVAGAIGSAIIGGDKHQRPASEAVASQPKAAGAPAPAPAANAQTLKLTADASGQLAFDKKTLSAKAGAVTIDMTNPSPVSHNISLQGPGGVSTQGKIVAKGGTSTVSADVKAGQYTFYCSVPGHRQGGMQGTLTVK